MKCSLRIARAITVLLPLSISLCHAHRGPFDGKSFRGRIALSADGNFNDEDDWAASPVALAILAESGLRDKLVHCDYNNILPRTDPEWEREHATGLLGAAQRYGFREAVFHDCQKDLEGAIQSIRDAINASSAENPLYFILAGPMEVPARGIERSDPAKRKFVYCISHSRWNDGYASVAYVKHNKRDIIPLGVTWVQVTDQNALLSTSPYGRPATEAEWLPWTWMRESQDQKVRFLWDRMRASKRADCSDAGMTYFLVTGDEHGDPAKLRRLLEEHRRPDVIDPRRSVRLEAENFRTLEESAVEYVNDRTASQRICVKLGRGSAGGVRTRLDEPYAATRARYDVDVRYAGVPTAGVHFRLLVNGRQRGDAWEAPAGAVTWQTQTLRGVEIRDGDELRVAVRRPAGAEAKVDYVQLNTAEPARGAVPAAPTTLRVAVVQQAREPELAANRDKIARFIAQAKARGCRLVIFPEDALGSPLGTTAEALEQSMGVIREAARSHDIYAIVCAAFPIAGLPADKRGNFLRVIGPDGRILQDYNKLICNLPAGDPRRAPGLFEVDGIPCCAMICADRWLRGVEELPVTLGAKILIDCSANARKEWIPEFGWYLPVTRALRNTVYAIFCNMGEHPQSLDEPRHGHSAIINPDGSFVASADDRGDQMLVATLDLQRATAAEAKRRQTHPAFQPFWELGQRILSGEAAEITLPEPYPSPEVSVAIAAAQMACSSEIPSNLDRMARMIAEAARNHADVVLFPELAVTGAQEEDVKRADAESLTAALARIRATAQQHRIAVVFGMPRVDGSRRWNAAYAIGPDGAVLTCYDQMVVDRRELFAEGHDAKCMWFTVKGVPAVVTIGADARWNEIGELAAARGAHLLFSLAYDVDVSDVATQHRTQSWVQLASFSTFSATVNAADPSGLSTPSVGAKGGSAIWEDFDGHKKQPGADVEVFSQYSASRVVSAGAGETILYATRTLPKRNTYLQQLIGRRYPYLDPWYALGARLISGGR